MLRWLRFRPTLVPTLFTVPAVLIMIGLSLWQIDRLQWKTALIAERHARIAVSPVTLPPTGADPTNLEFRRAAVTGTFLHDKEMLLGARSLRGNVGYQVVTPFELADGGIVLVNRGWIPVERREPGTRADGQILGRVAIEGVIRLPQSKAWLQPENDPGRNQWFYLDVAAMAKEAGLPARADLYIEAGPAENPGGYPIGGQARIDIPNDHLQYALTWAMLAVALVVIYVAYHVKLEQERKGKA